MIACSSCHEAKPEEEFYVRKSGRRDHYCKGCRRARSREDFAQNRDKRRARQAAYRAQPEARERRRLLDVRGKYGLTREEYETLPKECEACGATADLVIDHDHATGAYRGVLCGDCNRGLGFMRDDPERLIAAAMYLLAADGTNRGLFAPEGLR